tara:strand:- start:541 stop:1143 length:603 start_codon:yes stop_codon:yes gene_type:complete
MSFIKSKEHLNNYLKKLTLENSHIVDASIIPSIDFYAELSHLGLLDVFTWAVKNNPLILHENEFFHWLKFNTLSVGTNIYYDKRYTKEFIDKMEDLKDLPGIYAFFNKDDICLYIGTSITLGERINTSFKERFVNYHMTLYLKYLLTQTRSDAFVLETVAIAKYKPAYNTTGKYDDELTINISLPDFSNPIACNLVKEIK